MLRKGGCLPGMGVWEQEPGRPASSEASARAYRPRLDPPGSGSAGDEVDLGHVWARLLVAGPVAVMILSPVLWTPLIPLRSVPEQGLGDRNKLCYVEQATSESRWGEERRSVLCTEPLGCRLVPLPARR